MAMITVEEFRDYLEQVGKYGVQLITVIGNPTSGNFYLSFENAITTSIRYNALATEVQDKLGSLSTIGLNKVHVEGPAGGPWQVVLNKDVDNGPISLSSHTLGGGSNPNVTVDLANDTVLGRIANRATSMIEQILGFSFNGYTTGTDKVVRSYGGEYLKLPPHEPGSISQLYYVDPTSPITGFEETDAGNLLAPISFIAFGYEPGCWGVTRYTVTANWGYGEAPDALKEVCLEIAVNIWRGRQTGMWSDVQGAEGGSYLKFTGGMTKQQKDIVEAVRAKYREVPI